MNRIMTYLIFLPAIMAAWCLPVSAGTVFPGDTLSMHGNAVADTSAAEVLADSLTVPVYWRDSLVLLRQDPAGVVVVPDGFSLKDSVIYVPAPAVDTTLAGSNVFSILPSVAGGDAADVRVRQTSEIRTSMEAHFAGNASRHIGGYRIRIFFDNRQSSREDSEKVADAFRQKFHDIPVYRSYVNPYFKVTVGDFRSRSEAMQLLETIRRDFPAAFIVKEKSISYPAVDKANAVVPDTVKVLYRLPEDIVII